MAAASETFVMRGLAPPYNAVSILGLVPEI
jgi:hypothetical protein